MNMRTRTRLESCIHQKKPPALPQQRLKCLGQWGGDSDDYYASEIRWVSNVSTACRMNKSGWSLECPGNKGNCSGHTPKQHSTWFESLVDDFIHFLRRASWGCKKNPAAKTCQWMSMASLSTNKSPTSTGSSLATLFLKNGTQTVQDANHPTFQPHGCINLSRWWLFLKKMLVPF